MRSTTQTLPLRTFDLCITFIFVFLNQTTWFPLSKATSIRPASVQNNYRNISPQTSSKTRTPSNRCHLNEHVHTFWTTMHESIQNSESRYAKNAGIKRRTVSVMESVSIQRPTTHQHILSNQRRSPPTTSKSQALRSILKTPTFAERIANSKGILHRRAPHSSKRVTFGPTSSVTACGKNSKVGQALPVSPLRQQEKHTPKRSKMTQVSARVKRTIPTNLPNNSPGAPTSNKMPSGVVRTGQTLPINWNSAPPYPYSLPCTYENNLSYRYDWSTPYGPPVRVKDGRWFADPRTRVYWDDLSDDREVSL